MREEKRGEEKKRIPIPISHSIQKRPINMIKRQRINDSQRIPSIPIDPTKTHETDGDDRIKSPPQSPPVMAPSPGPDSACMETAKESVDMDTTVLEGSGREKLRRHRTDVAGQVWIPEIWGQEELLKDWIDCAAFDNSLVPNGIMSAREALVEECRRASSGGLQIENRC